MLLGLPDLRWWLGRDTWCERGE